MYFFISFKSLKFYQKMSSFFRVKIWEIINLLLIFFHREFFLNNKKISLLHLIFLPSLNAKHSGLNKKNGGHSNFIKSYNLFLKNLPLTLNIKNCSELPPHLLHFIIFFPYFIEKEEISSLHFYILICFYISLHFIFTLKC